MRTAVSRGRGYDSQRPCRRCNINLAVFRKRGLCDGCWEERGCASRWYKETASRPLVLSSIVRGEAI